MDERAAIDILTAKVQALEARLAELSSSDAGKVAAFGGEAAIKQTVDPKGRKIWESEWVMDHGALMCYVPDNALIIDGQNVAVESDDKEGSEVTLSGGSWYLHVFKSDETGEYSADFDDEPTGSREGETAKYNIHICDINEKGYIEKQYVVGSIVINAKPSIVGETDDSEKIDGDVEVSGKLDQADNGTSCGIEFKTVSAREAQGTDPARPPRIIADIKGRHDEENGCDAETWGCHKLTIKGKDEDKIIHFLGCDDAIVVGEDGGGSGGGGAENVIGSDYIKVEDEEEEDDDGNVTTKRKVSAKIQTSDPNPSSPAEHALLTHDTDQLVRSKKTFLGSSPLANSKKVIVDGPNGRIELRDATGKKVIFIDADDIPSDCGGELKVHKLKFKDAQGNEHTYHGLFCADIELPINDDLKEFVWNDQLVAKFQGTEDIDIGTKRIIGSGRVVVTENENEIVISDAMDDSLVAGAGITVVERTVSVNTDNASVETANGQTNDLKKVQLYGFSNISGNQTQYSVGQALVDQVASGEFVLVAANIGGVMKLAYKPLDPLPLEAAQNSGLAFSRSGSAGSRKLQLDLAGRGSAAFGVNDVKVGGVSTGVKVFSSGDLNLDGIDIEAGRGVSVTPSGDNRRIDAEVAGVESDSPKLDVGIDSNGIVHIDFVDGEEEEESDDPAPAVSGFTGVREVVKAVWYDLSSHQLKRTTNQWTYNNGLLVSVGDDVTTVIETAVAETVS